MPTDVFGRGHVVVGGGQHAHEDVPARRDGTGQRAGIRSSREQLQIFYTNRKKFMVGEGTGRYSLSLTKAEQWIFLTDKVRRQVIGPGA